MKKIDMHVHTQLRRSMNRPGTGSTYCSPEELIAKYDEIGVEYGVILPTVNPECSLGDQQSHEDIIEITERYPDRFTWFVNVDPRAVSNAPDADLSCVIRYYKERGAKGVGEISANLAFNDPKVENLFHHCEINDMPVIFHISPFPDRMYGLYDRLGLPLLEGALQKFPRLKFLGHSQPFWAEIAADLKEEERNSYPPGTVVPGRVVELMRKYPNLCGDLSAGSGFNALSRDEAFGYAFLDEFADRLYFGTDFCAPENVMPLSGWLDKALAGGHIRTETYEKISRKNAEALLGM